MNKNRNKIGERFFVDHLKDRLSHLYKKIFSHVNLANNTNFRKALNDNIGYIPVLNEIDLIFQSNQGKLMAIEVKFCKIKGRKISRPFYDGIGQALSLLRYGFDNVGLWHLYLDDIDQKIFDRYGASAWHFIRNKLMLPLEFTYFKIENYHSKPKFIVMQYLDDSTGAKLIPIDSPNFQITWKYPNPISNTSHAQTLRIALERSLGITN